MTRTERAVRRNILVKIKFRMRNTPHPGNWFRTTVADGDYRESY